MKKIILLLFGLFAIESFVNAQAIQAIYVANNNPGAGSPTDVNVFTGTNALRDALTAAAPNDIIYVVPSNITYGNISITKAITIFGVGIRPAKELGARSFVDFVNVDASNVRLSGLISEQDEIRLGWNIGTANIDGIIIENCRVERILMTGTPSSTVSNMIIRNNVITGAGSIATHILTNTVTPGTVIVTNNIFTEGNISAQPMIKATDVTFSYNTFVASGDRNEFGAITNCIFDHNIFYGVRVDAGTVNGTSFSYNLAFGNSIDSYNVFNVSTNGNSGTGNIESVGGNNDPLLTNFPLTSSWNDSFDASLLPGSPAINIDGIAGDAGSTGGSTPFVYEGNLLPLIQSITIPSTIPVGSDLPVTIKAKGN